MYLIIFAGICIFVFVEIMLYEYGKKKDDVDCDVMIVLGAGLHGDQLSSALKRRLDVALEYAKTHPDTCIIVSGGQGRHELVSEAYAMKQYLIAQGIKEGRILKEDTSTSTYTNFLNTKMLLQHTHEILVCTCDFHMYRSCRIARHLGFTPYRQPAKSTNINCIKYYIREFFCVVKNWILQT